ncbi:MAG: calcium-binding protein [Pseudomonadota bacterium]
MTSKILGTDKRDLFTLGTGSQTVDAGDGNDRIVSWGDAGEPDPAQTNGAEGRVYPAVPTEDTIDTLTGGSGADRFEFRAVLNAKEEVIAEHTNAAGRTKWNKVAGENDSVHDHWVEGFGLDIITDFSKDEGDCIVIAGHTATVQSITYGSDAQGSYSLITVISQQGDGGAGGANTATGAHDEDPLGQIKVYGDKVTEDDLHVQNNTDGIDRLEHADAAFAEANAGGTMEVFSNTDGDTYEGNLYRQKDVVHVGEGSQTVDAGGGHDRIYSYSDGGEPDPAQTNGSEGRVNPALADGAGDDVLKGGQGRDTFAFRLLLNAKEEILEKHTRDDGSVNWRKVAGENDNVHDHWVEGIGNDTILDFSNQDGDKIDIRGHTVEIAEITYGEDDGGDYSLIQLRSQQGDGGGAHDEDLLGTIKVYGDKVTEDDITVKAKVFYGIDDLEDIAAGEAQAPASTPPTAEISTQAVAENADTINLAFEGTDRNDLIKTGSGRQTVDGGSGNDRFISYGDAGEPDPAQTNGSEGRYNPAISAGSAEDTFTGGAGRDTFEFHALLNGTAAVLAQHTGKAGHVHWRGVAGENDNVHDHWVEGWGNDTITDFSKAEGDKIVLRGHTVELDSITYGTDAGGDYSLITAISQQGDGGAGGANTATGAHDEDFVGTVKVYGDRITEDDVKVQRSGVFDGVDRLEQADELSPYNGGVQEFASATNSENIVTAAPGVETKDYVDLGTGAQTVSTGAGRDKIRVYSDGGEPDPAQTNGADGRINPAVPSAQAVDVVTAGQGKDEITFNYLLNATNVVMARHTRDDGTINWRKVAGENEAMHDHWVEAGGDDVLTDFSNQDGDKLILRGHTVEIAEITYGVDEGGDYSLISVRSQQGDGGGAHDEDDLGTVKVYGDKVTEDDIQVKAKGVFDGIDAFEPIENAPNHIAGTNQADSLTGTSGADNIHGNRGDDQIKAGSGNDFVFGDSGVDTLFGEAGDDWIEGSWGRDTMDGGAGEDTLVADRGKDTLIGGADADVFQFKDTTKGGSILDWEDGLDKIDLSRLDNVDGLSDVSITQESATLATVTFENNKGQEVDVAIFSVDAFTLTANDFLL